MKKLEWIIERIDEELNDAETYIDKALICKDRNPEWANSYYQISQQELAHAEVVHNIAAKMLDNFTEEIPGGIEWFWDREHARYIDKAARIKVKYDIYKK